MRMKMFVAVAALSALTACHYFEKKPMPEPEPSYPVTPAPDPYPQPVPEPSYPTVPAPDPYTPPAGDYVDITDTYQTEPTPYPAPEPYPAEPAPYPTPQPYPAEPVPYPQPYPTTPPPGGGPVADAAITLDEGPCFGTCPIYTMTIYPTEFYELNAGQFTVNPGQSTGNLPAGSWAAARAALVAADFNNLPGDVTPGNPAACGNQVATDLPTAKVTEITIAGPTTVNYYPGCFQAPDKAALDQLIASLRTAMQVETLVTP